MNKKPFVINKITIVAILILSAFTLAGVQTRDPFFARLEGDWTGEGTTQALKARIWTKWESVLEDKFFRLSLEYEAKTESEKPNVFSGHAYYQTKESGIYEGQWFDSIGNQYPVQAKLENNSLVALWGIAGKIEGKSVYRLTNSNKQLEITDFLKQKDGMWKEFNYFKLHRK